jgi:hypothetical protein
MPGKQWHQRFVSEEGLHGVADCEAGFGVRKEGGPLGTSD